MRFNFISESGDGMGFAHRCFLEGNDVRLWIRSTDAKAVGDNVVPKVGDFEDLLVDADKNRDIFVFDVTGNGVIADYLRSEGFPVLGGSVLADRLERDRKFGAKTMKDCGIQIPKTVTFRDFEKAKTFVVENSDSRWVYKPSKQLGDLSPSHVSYDAEDLVEMLTSIEQEVSIANPEFELQEFIEGVALSTELWFEEGALITPLCNHTLERKEFMNENLGASGGCSGNIAWFCEDCPICDQVKRLAPWAERNRYSGMLDLNCIVADSGLYGLEFTPRFGYDASPTLLWELVNGKLSEFFFNVATGSFTKLNLRPGFASGLRVSIPPWPSEKFNADSDVPIRGLHPRWEEHTYLYNVMSNDAGLCTAGAWGIVLLFTGHARTIRGSFTGPLEWADNLRLKNKQYRTDLAKQFQEDLSKIEVSIGEVIQ